MEEGEIFLWDPRKTHCSLAPPSCPPLAARETGRVRLDLVRGTSFFSPVGGAHRRPSSQRFFHTEIHAAEDAVGSQTSGEGLLAGPGLLTCSFSRKGPGPPPKFACGKNAGSHKVEKPATVDRVRSLCESERTADAAPGWDSEVEVWFSHHGSALDSLDSLPDALPC